MTADLSRTLTNLNSLMEANSQNISGTLSHLNAITGNMAGILETLAEWLVSVSQWFNGWDITLLVPALIILTVIAGVTGRAATGPRLWMQLAWGTVTVILGLIEVAIIWTIIARYLPVADMGALIQNMLQRKPLLVAM